MCVASKPQHAYKLLAAKQNRKANKTIQKQQKPERPHLFADERREVGRAGVHLVEEVLVQVGAVVLERRDALGKELFLVCLLLLRAAHAQHHHHPVKKEGRKGRRGGQVWFHSLYILVFTWIDFRHFSFHFWTELRWVVRACVALRCGAVAVRNVP